MVTFQDVKNNKELKTYIENADASLKALGFTEHSYAHVNKVAKDAYDLLIGLGYPERTAELARIAGYMHDIGNVINRIDHAQSGAVMAFRLLDKMGMGADEISIVIAAIGNHDESTAVPVNPVAAALILADKSDVRRSRVRNAANGNRKGVLDSFDIYDRVNYAVEWSTVKLDIDHKAVELQMQLHPEISAVMDYFEIFLSRMVLCKRAAEFLGLRFQLKINDYNLL